MIENDDQLNQTQLAINDLEAAMAALKRDVLPLNAERFAVMAEPIVDHIRELQLQVEESKSFEATSIKVGTIPYSSVRKRG